MTCRCCLRSASSFALLRANSKSLTRVARMECGQSEGPLAWETPRAILSRRLDGGMGPLKGVTRCAGSASKVYIREYEGNKTVEKTERTYS